MIFCWKGSSFELANSRNMETKSNWSVSDTGYETKISFQIKLNIFNSLKPYGGDQWDPSEPKAAIFVRDKNPVILKDTLTLTNLRNFIKQEIQNAKNQKVTTPSDQIPKQFKDELWKPVWYFTVVKNNHRNTWENTQISKEKKIVFSMLRKKREAKKRRFSTYFLN